MRDTLATSVHLRQTMPTSFPAASQSQRLFLGLWPDADVRHQLADHVGQWTWPAGCVQYQPEDWHVTLHFIGQVAADQVDELCSYVDMPQQPFELVLDQPRLWSQGLAVLCGSVVPEPLRELHDQLGQVLRGLGLPVDARPCLPPVTLARRAEGALAPSACTPVRWGVRSYALVVSTRETDQRYRVLLAYGL